MVSYSKSLFLIIFISSLIKISLNVTITLPFKKQKIDLTNISPKNIVFPTLLNNYLYSEIEVGSNKQKIPLKIEFSSYLFYISGKETNSQIKFDESASSTFKQITNHTFYNNKNLQEGYIGSDYITIDNNKFNTEFILGTNVENNATGVIGLNIEDSRDKSLNQYNIIDELKKNKIINQYYFTFKYNNNEGSLIIGELPENYDKKYKGKTFIDTYTKLAEDDFTWKINLDSIFIADDINSREQKKVGGSTTGYFYIERNVIEGTDIYRQEILNTFFNENIKQGICFEENTSMYFTYYCKKNVNFDKFKNLFFYNKELNYNFEFTYKDLFFYNELDENYYFLVVFNNEVDDDGGYLNYLWIFGEPFFKKYQLVFNKDTKRIGLYTESNTESNDNEKKNEKTWYEENKWYLYLVIALVILLIGLGVTIFLYINKGPKRKAKANELEDDFEYNTSDTKDQKLFN